MAHLAKYTAGSACGVLKHDERTDMDKVQSRKNESIVSSRTYLNYNLAPIRKFNSVEKTVTDYTNREKIHLLKRKDVNIMCSWVVSLPKNISSEDEQNKFFRELYRFLEKRYGHQSKNGRIENIITATVHLDETTPHMHFGFIPVAYDKNKDRYTVSAKLVSNRTDLQTFHKDLSNYMLKVFNRDVGIENGATKDGNQTVEQLKRQSKLAKDIQSKEQELQQVTEKARNLTAEAQKANKEVETLRNEKNRLEGQIKPLEACFDQYSEIEYLGKRKIGGKIVLSADEATKLKKQACAFWSAQGKAEKVQQENLDLKRRYSGIEDRLDKSRNTVVELKIENQRLNKELSYIESVIQSNPELLELYNNQVKKLAQAKNRRNKGFSL